MCENLKYFHCLINHYQATYMYLDSPVMYLPKLETLVIFFWGNSGTDSSCYLFSLEQRLFFKYKFK